MLTTCSRLPARTRSAAFTLIELLVALTILAILSLLAVRGLSAILRARDDLTAHQTRLREQNRFLQTLQQDLQGLATPEKNALPYLPLWIDSVNQQGRLTLLRERTVSGQASRYERIQYTWENQRIYRSQQVWSAASASIDRLANAAPDAPDTAARTRTEVRTEILRGVGRLEFAAYLADGGWRTQFVPYATPTTSSATAPPPSVLSSPTGLAIRWWPASAVGAEFAVTTNHSDVGSPLQRYFGVGRP